MRIFTISLSLVAALALSGAQAEELRNPFFAMDTGTRDATHKTPAEQVALVKELGFDGVGPIYRGVDDLRLWNAALDAAGLRHVALYVALRLDDPDQSLATLREAAGALRGRDTMLWLYVTDKAHKASAADNDDAAVAALQTVAVIAKDAGLRVALYPHTGFYVERVEDAVRLVGKAQCDNLGVTFNLCHWLKVDGQDLVASLRAARPHLYCVTVNGADAGGKEWRQLIQPLGRGTYNVGELLRLLRETRYAGPIGLQHFGIGGDARENLGQSIAAWKKLTAPSP